MLRDRSTIRVTAQFTNCVAFAVMAERVIDRALKWAREKGWNQSDFAERMGVAPANVTNWKQRGMPADLYARAATVLGRSVDALLAATDDLGAPGVGAAGAPASSAVGLNPILAWEHPDDLPDGEFVFVPRLEVQLSAGHGRDQVEIQFMKAQPQAFRSDWIRRERLRPAKLASMYAHGDSMEPSIWDGDSLVVDTSQTAVVDGRVYALWYDGGERVKRLYRLPGGGLRIKSDNSEYPAIDLGPESLEHVRVIGRVVHRAGKGGL